MKEKMEIEYDEPIKIKGNWNGIPVADVCKKLSTSGGLAFTQVISLLKVFPNNIDRNDLFADILDEAYNTFGEVFGLSSWRNKNIVTLIDIGDETADELSKITLEITKRGKHGWTMDGRVFWGFVRWTAKEHRFYFFDTHLYITPDEKLLLESPEETLEWTPNGD